MKRKSLLILLWSILVCFGATTPNTRWVYPSDIYDKEWDNIIDSLIPDTIPDKLDRITNIDKLDSIIDDFRTNSHRVFFNNGPMILIRRNYFPAYIIYGISLLADYDIGIVAHSYFYGEKFEKLYDWYSVNKDKIDLATLKRLVGALYITEFVTDSFHTFRELNDIAPRLPEVSLFNFTSSSWMESLSNREKALIDSFINTNPDCKAIDLQIIDEKLSHFIHFHRGLWINDSNADMLKP
ncbi:MAG: hypothetical protein K2I64_00430 [Muribaculaceae bacterium]|nr:hypothetical protein [Muribaculaceae bacterium]